MKLLRRLFLVLTVLFFYKLYSGGYDTALTEIVRKKLITSNIRCDFKSLEIAFPLALNVEDLTCEKLDKINFIPKIAHMRISPEWAKFLELALGIRIDTALTNDYNKQSLVISRFILDGKSSAEIELDHFSLNPLFESGTVKGLSVTGEISGILALKFTSQNDLFGGGKFVIENGNIKLSAGESALIKIPSVEKLHLSLPIRISPESILIEQLWSSTVGDFSGKVCLNDYLQKVSYEIKGLISLSDVGVKSLGGYLALAAGKDPTNVSQDWELQISGAVSAAPKLKLLPLDKGKTK